MVPAYEAQKLGKAADQAFEGDPSNLETDISQLAAVHPNKDYLNSLDAQLKSQADLGFPSLHIVPKDASGNFKITSQGNSSHPFLYGASTDEGSVIVNSERSLKK